MRINHQITAKEARVIGSDNQMKGVYRVAEAIAMAESEGLDLVEISPNAEPPVCKIIDSGKYRYEQQKKAHEAKVRLKVMDLKEIKVRPNIAGGDFDVKVKNAIRFLKSGDKVRICLMFRGREIAHNEVGYQVVNRFKEALLEFCRIETDVRMEGRQIFMILAPKSKSS